MNILILRRAKQLLIAILTVTRLAGTCQAQLVTSDPTGLGQVFEKATWRTPEDVARANGHNEILEEYLLVRKQTPDSDALHKSSW